VADRYFASSEEILAELEEALPRLRGHRDTTEAPPPGEGAGLLRRHFQALGVATIVGAGLLDGINPCALATLVFLLSYLGVARRSPREIAWTGVLFAAGVFTAYLGMGVGAFRALQSLEGFTTVSRLLYPVMAGGTLLLAVYSWRDYRRARAGQPGDMTLKLPASLQGLSHALIRRSARLPALLGVAFFLGLAVAVLELFCTGQIYLPTLMYMWGDPGLRVHAGALLVLYVTMFTLPVLVLTGLLYAGSSSASLARWAREHTATVKLATVGLFLLLTAYLAYVAVGLYAA
jgi:hypothetical protein